jgi:2'-5' RNA ligase
VTIARRADRELIDALASRTLGDIVVEWQVDRVVLYRSHTGTPAGSSYEPLAEVRL